MLNPDTFSFRVSATEEWINSFLESQNLTIEIREGYRLGNFKILISPLVVRMSADLISKPGTSVEIVAAIFWNADSQSFSFENLEIETRGKNLFLKGAGWIADNFMQEKIGNLFQQKVNEIFQSEINKVVSKKMKIPGPPNGIVEVNPGKIIIHHILFGNGIANIDLSFMGKIQVLLGDFDPYKVDN